jgi:leader peptidase (prepilin peptidase) / N-methyltransferase
MESMAALLTLPFALAIGSFLNVVAVRMPERRSVVTPGSACVSCRAEIAWYDNLPVVSYLLLRGRCRDCGARIGLRSPLVELLTAALIVAVVWRFGLTAEALVGTILVTGLVALSVIDLEHQILPNRIVLPMLAAVLAVNVVSQPDRWLEWTISALAASGFLFAAAIAYPGGMGLGDVKLAAVLGAALGWSVAVAMMIGLGAGALVGLAVIARHGSAGRKQKIPLGPFLAFGAVVALFFGDALLGAYLDLMS